MPFNEIFKTFDCVYLPAAPSVAPFINKSNDNVNEDFVILDNWLGIGNFGGFPSITIPLAFNKENKMPYGVNLMAKPYDEVNLFGIASALEEEIGLKNVSTHTFNSKEGE